MVALPPPAVAIIVYYADEHWRARSQDGLYAGVFVSRQAAVREATAEAQAHPGRICLVADRPEG